MTSGQLGRFAVSIGIKARLAATPLPRWQIA
jgi:hypothetical protein